MKKIILFTSIFINFLSFSQTTNIPDVNFENYLETHNASGDIVALGASDSMGNGILNDALVLTSRINNVFSLNVGSNSIEDLTGIEGFTNLTHLSCNSNLITNLDITQNTNLTYLDCNDNLITSLNVSQNANLSQLSCSNNQLTNIDITQNTLLVTLNCSYNQLTNINVTQNPDLQMLFCNFNQITDLDVTLNISLEFLYCNNNLLTNLNVTQNTYLQILFCSYNQITSIEVTQNPDLQILFCDSNQLTSLDVTHNSSLQTLFCNNNLLTSLNVAQNTYLDRLTCSFNQITSLDISQNTILSQLSCAYNQLTFLNLDLNNNLDSFYCNNNTNLIALKIRNGANNLLANFDARNCPNLSCIYVDNVADATAGINDYVNWQIDENSNYVANDTECNTYFDPTNNNCSNAINLIVGVDFEAQAIIATNIGATVTTDINASCGSINQPEVWFSVTVPNSGNISIETQEVNGSAMHDSVIAVFSGSCENLTELDCNDDNITRSLFSLIELTNQTPGDILYITAYTYGEGSSGEFKISAYDDSLANLESYSTTNLSLYPNPVDKILYIKSKKYIETIQIYNMLGQVVLTKETVLNNTKLDLSSLPSGNYIVKTQSHKQIETYKLIKK